MPAVGPELGDSVTIPGTIGPASHPVVDSGGRYSIAGIVLASHATLTISDGAIVDATTGSALTDSIDGTIEVGGTSDAAHGTLAFTGAQAVAGDGSILVGAHGLLGLPDSELLAIESVRNDARFILPVSGAPSILVLTAS